MGPRLVGRGKLAEMPPEVASTVRLQWGRVLWDAERGQPFRNGCEDWASMGPRLVGRGKMLPER